MIAAHASLRAAMQRVVSTDPVRERERALDILIASAPPENRCWGCQECGHYAVSGGAAANHVATTGHALPELEPLPEPPDDPKGLGRVVRAGVDLRLAVAIAQVFFGMLEHSRVDVQQRTCGVTTRLKNQLDQIEQRIARGDA